MRARALVALAIAWALVAVAPASAQEGEQGAAPGLGPGAADPEPVHRPGRRGLPDLVDQLRPARQLQPQGPRADARDRGELGDLGRTRRRSPSSCSRGHKWSDGAADHVEGRQVQPRDVRAQQPAVPELRREHHLGRDAGRPDRRRQDEAARRAHRRRPVRLHPARAHLGQAVDQVAHRVIQAAGADRRQRPLRGHGGRSRPHHPDGAQSQLPGRDAEVQRASVDQVRHQRRGRARAHAG